MDLYYEIEGEGEPILLLHGFLGSSEIWKDFIDHFKSDNKVITIDLPGHGKSGCEEDIIEMKDVADGVESILQKENIKPVHIVGHSMGGYVSLAFAKKFPDKIKSLTLFNSTAKEDNEQKKSDRLKAVRVFDMNPSIFINEAVRNLFYDKNLDKLHSDVEKLVSIAQKTSVKGAQASLRGMRLREDMVEWLQQQSFPIHYIAGKHDNTVPYQNIIDQLPERAKLTTLENSGHMGFVEEKEVCLKALEAFFTQE